MLRRRTAGRQKWHKRPSLQPMGSMEHLGHARHALLFDRAVAGHMDASSATTPPCWQLHAGRSVAQPSSAKVCAIEHRRAFSPELCLPACCCVVKQVVRTELGRQVFDALLVAARMSHIVADQASVPFLFLSAAIHVGLHCAAQSVQCVVATIVSGDVRQASTAACSGSISLLRWYRQTTKSPLDTVQQTSCIPPTNSRTPQVVHVKVGQQVSQA